MNVSTGQHDGYYNPATGEVAQTSGGSVDLTAVNDSITQLTANDVATAITINSINSDISQLQAIDVANAITLQGISQDITQLQTTDVATALSINSISQNITQLTATSNNQASTMTTFGQNIADNAADIATNTANKANDVDVVKLTGDQNITGTKGFTDLVARGDGSTAGQSGKLLLKCSNNSHGVTIQSPPHSASATYTLTLPIALPTVTGQVLSSDLLGNLSWVTMTSSTPVLKSNNVSGNKPGISASTSSTTSSPWNISETYKQVVTLSNTTDKVYTLLGDELANREMSLMFDTDYALNVFNANQWDTTCLIAYNGNTTAEFVYEFNTSTSLSEVKAWNVPERITPSSTRELYGTENISIKYWSGSAWVAVSNASTTGFSPDYSGHSCNITFTSVSAKYWKFVLSTSSPGFGSHIGLSELELWG